MKILGMLFGLVIQFTGIVWDGIWHARNGMEEPSLIPPPHFVYFVGIVICVFMAYRLVRLGSPLSKVIIYFIAGASSVQLIGWLWDNLYYHARGIELGPLAPPHAMVNGGFYTLIIVSIIAGIKMAGIKKKQKLNLQG